MRGPWLGSLRSSPPDGSSTTSRGSSHSPGSPRLTNSWKAAARPATSSSTFHDAGGARAIGRGSAPRPRAARDRAVAVRGHVALVRRQCAAARPRAPPGARRAQRGGGHFGRAARLHRRDARVRDAERRRPVSAPRRVPRIRAVRCRRQCRPARTAPAGKRLWPAARPALRHRLLSRGHLPGRHEDRGELVPHRAGRRARASSSARWCSARPCPTWSAGSAAACRGRRSPSRCRCWRPLAACSCTSSCPRARTSPRRPASTRRRSSAPSARRRSAPRPWATSATCGSCTRCGPSCRSCWPATAHCTGRSIDVSFWSFVIIGCRCRRLRRWRAALALRRQRAGGLRAAFPVRTVLPAVALGVRPAGALLPRLHGLLGDRRGGRLAAVLGPQCRDRAQGVRRLGADHRQLHRLRHHRGERAVGDVAVRSCCRSRRGSCRWRSGPRSACWPWLAWCAGRLPSRTKLRKGSFANGELFVPPFRAMLRRSRPHAPSTGVTHAEQHRRPVPGHPRRGPRPLRAVPRRVPPRDRREARLPGGVRRCPDQGWVAGGADPHRLRRLGARTGGGQRDHGRDQPGGRQFRRVPRPDVQHGHAAAPRLRGAEAEVPAAHRERRTAPAVDGRHRTDHRDGHHQDQDDRGAQGRPLRGQRAEGVDLARPALRPDDPAGSHHPARRGEEEVRGHVDLPRRPAPRGEATA